MKVGLKDLIPFNYDNINLEYDYFYVCEKEGLYDIYLRTSLTDVFKTILIGKEIIKDNLLYAIKKLSTLLLTSDILNKNNYFEYLLKYNLYLTDEIQHIDFIIYLVNNIEYKPLSFKLSDSEQSQLINHNVFSIIYFENLNVKLSKSELKRIEKNDYKLINKKEFLDIIVVSINYKTIIEIENQTEAVCLSAIKNNGLALKFILDKTDELCMLAVKQNGLALEYVPNRTYEICIEAVRQNGLALRYVNQ